MSRFQYEALRLLRYDAQARPPSINVTIPIIAIRALWRLRALRSGRGSGKALTPGRP